MAYELSLPNLGEGIDSADVVSVFVSAGDTIAVDQDLLEVETGKASMPIPSTVAGVIEEVLFNEGDSLSPAQVLFKINTDGAAAPSAEAPQPAAEPEKAPAPAAPAAETPKPAAAPAPSTAPAAPANSGDIKAIPASPSVRRFAREIGININEVPGSGDRGRISKEDVKAYSKQKNTSGVSSGGGIAAQPLPDLSKFGPTHSEKLSGIRKVTAQHMSYCWSQIPHVTHYDKADITELEALRKKIGPKLKIDHGGKLTITSILLKITALALKKFPKFNSSLDSINNEIVYKDYINIGVAVDTPKGLVVPVIKDVDSKSITEISADLGRYSSLAREGKLTPNDMQGGSFTISNLGGIGGNAFTPIVNWPEVAILGVSRGEQEPVYIDGSFQPRLRVPLSLSYDHRVIDGADAARFTRWICVGLEEAIMMHM